MRTSPPRLTASEENSDSKRPIIQKLSAVWTKKREYQMGTTEAISMRRELCRKPRLAPQLQAARNRKSPTDEDKLNMEIRKFLKEVGVTSERESTTLTS